MMAIRPTVKPITAADVASLADDKGFEIANGEWVEREMAGELHGAIATNLILAIGGFVKANRLGRVYPADTTYVLEGDETDIQTLRLPDVSFVSAGRVKQSDRHGYYYRAPDLAIEIVSPSERAGDTQAKINDYLRAGTLEVWVVYPETRQITVHRPDGTATTYSAGQTIPGGGLLPDLSLDVAGVFEE